MINFMLELPSDCILKTTIWLFTDTPPMGISFRVMEPFTHPYAIRLGAFSHCRRLSSKHA